MIQNSIKMVATISICTLNSLNYLQTKFISDVNLPSCPGKSVYPHFLQHWWDTNNGNWCSQKVIGVSKSYKNIIENLKRVFKLFWSTIWSFNEWFICFFYQAVFWSIMKVGRNSLIFLFQCARQVGFRILQNMFALEYLLYMKQI